MGKNNDGAHGRLRITDPKRLAAAIRLQIDRDYDGNTSAAARVLGISQPQLHRLQRGSTRYIRVSTAVAIRPLFPKASPTLDDCILSKTQQTLMEVCDEWLDKAWWNAIEGTGVWWVEKDGGIVALRGGEAKDARLSAFGAHVRFLRKRFQREFARLDLKLSGLPLRYKALVYWRIVDPLLDSRASGFMAMGWNDLKAAKLATFVRAAIRRELLLCMDSWEKRAESIVRLTPQKLERGARLPASPVYLTLPRWNPIWAASRKTETFMGEPELAKLERDMKRWSRDDKKERR